MPRLLVIGGGVAGCTAIVGLRKLDKRTDIVLVEPKDHCEIFWAAFRSPFEDWIAKDSLVSLREWTKKYNVEHVRSIVTKLSAQEATLQNGQVVTFDACVVATGAADNCSLMGRGVPSGDGSRISRLKTIKESGERVLNCNSVVIVGGGFIGTELAGDIRAYSKQRKQPVSVTLVHSGPTLCDKEISEKAGQAVQRKLDKLGVEVLLNEKAEEQSDGSLLLKNSGKVLKADEIIYTTGLVPVNSFLQECFPGALNAEGWIVTDEHFRIQGQTNMFCIGDCSTLLPNAGNKYLSNMKVIGKNLKTTLDAVAKGKSASDVKLVKAKPGLKICVVTVGNKDGVAWSEFGHSQLLLPAVKNKTMFFHAKWQLGFPKQRRQGELAVPKVDSPLSAPF